MYIPGDPVPPRAYRERYRREAAKQAACAGYDITIALRQIQGPLRLIMAEMEGGTTQTDFEVMVWADISYAPPWIRGFGKLWPIGAHRLISARARCFG